MSQDFISLTLTDEQLTGAATGLGQMEDSLSGLQATPAAERGNLLYMGAKSEVFCRRTLRVMQANPHIVPPSLAEDLIGAAAGLDELRKELGARWSQGGRARVQEPVSTPAAAAKRTSVPA